MDKDNGSLIKSWADVKAFLSEGEISTISKALNIDLPASALKTDKFTNSFNGMQRPPIDYNYLARATGYNATHGICLELKKNLTAALGFYFKAKKISKDKLNKINAFLEQPNDRIEETDLSLLLNSMYDWYTYGRFAWEIVKDGDSVAVYHANAKDVYVKTAENSPEVTGYYNFVNGRESDKRYYEKFPMKKSLMKNLVHYMLVVDTYTPWTYYYGVPIYFSSLKAVVMNDIINQFFLNFFDNSARPDYLLAITGSQVSDKTMETLKGNMNSLKGYQNAHRAMVLNTETAGSDIKILKVGEPVTDSFRNVKNDNRDEIAQVHGVPPKIIGISSAGSLGSGNEAIGALKIFKEAIIAPQQRYFEKIINRFFSIIFDVNPEFTFNEINLSSDKDLAIVSDVLLKNGTISVNESREFNGYNTIDESKLNKVSAQMQTQNQDLKIESHSMDNLDLDANDDEATHRNKQYQS